MLFQLVTHRFLPETRVSEVMLLWRNEFLWQVDQQGFSAFFFFILVHFNFENSF